MTDCHKVEEQIQHYLEDLLPENQRAEIRKHLTHCHNCSVFLQQVGSFAGDLRHSAFAPLPESQLETLLREMERRESFPWRRAVYFFKTLLFALIAAGGIGLCVHGVQFLQNRIREERQKALQEKLEGSLVIQRLKSIDQRLSQYGSKSKSIENELEISKPSVSQTVVSLHPFHWHLDFDSAASRDRYVDRLRSAGAKFLYLSKETPVIELAYEKFLKLAKETSGFSGISSKERLVDFEHLPVSEKPVEVSFYFRYPNRQSKPHHWHLKFSLPNRFLFEGEAKRDFKFLFTEQDLWIVNVNSDEYVHLVQMIQGVQGIEADWGEEGQNPKLSNVRVPVMISLSGG